MSKPIPVADLQFGDKYDGEKHRRQQEHINRLTREVQRLQAVLFGGADGQVLTKIGPKDFQATWEDSTGGGGGGTPIVVGPGKLLGNPGAAAGPPVDITIGPGLSLIGDVLTDIDLPPAPTDDTDVLKVLIFGG